MKKKFNYFSLLSAIVIAFAVVLTVVFVACSKVQPPITSPSEENNQVVEKPEETPKEETSKEEEMPKEEEEEPKEEEPKEEEPKEEPKEEEPEETPQKSQTQIDYEEAMKKVEEHEKTVSSDPSAWNMILCNPTHSLSDDFFDSLNLTKIYDKYRVDSRIYYNVIAMFLAAELDGVSLQMCSAYRDINLQTRNFNNKKQEYINKGMSEEEAYKKTATIIAVPGTSEHHTGLALDIVTPSHTSLTASFDQTKAYKWLSEHCTEYGFILRYAKDKTDITKIIYEPWHYRYVGIENAKKIAASGLSYEEYLNVLD